jgi:hypothetical protein
MEATIQLPRPGPVDPLQAMVMQFQPLLHHGSQITGMCISPSGRLLVANCTRLHVAQLAGARPWSSEQHAHWPPRFRAAVRALLMCAHGARHVAPPPPGQPEQQHSGIWSLPVELLLREVVSRMAHPPSAWADDDE